MQSDQLIHTQNINGWAKITLNRPKALHALNLPMVEQLHTALQDAEHNPSIYAVWLQSSTEKAFCAGGDVRAVREHVITNQAHKSDELFNAEYAIDEYMHSYTKPIVAWGQGYIMGGGMGLFVPSTFGVINPTTKIAMPEVSIGLFPDVGGSQFLAQRGTLGLFMGLTGVMLNAHDTLHLNFATHHTNATSEHVFNALAQINFADVCTSSACDNCKQKIADVLNGFNTSLVADGSLISELTSITANFGNNFASDYLAVCKLATSDNKQLQRSAINLQQGSVVSAGLTWLLWQWATHNIQAITWADVFTLETAIVQWKIRHADFAEGVRAKLVDKDNAPQWAVNGADITPSTKLADIMPPLPQVNVVGWAEVLQKFLQK